MLCSHLCSVVWSLLANGTVIAWNPYTRERISTVCSSHVSVVILLPWWCGICTVSSEYETCMVGQFVISHLYFACTVLFLYGLFRNMISHHMEMVLRCYIWDCVCLSVCLCQSACVHTVIGGVDYDHTFVPHWVMIPDNLTLFKDRFFYKFIPAVHSFPIV